MNMVAGPCWKWIIPSPGRGGLEAFTGCSAKVSEFIPVNRQAPRKEEKFMPNLGVTEGIKLKNVCE